MPYIKTGGTTCALNNLNCVTTDGSKAEAAACNCGTDAVAAVAKDKFCRVVTKKGYVTDAAKCSSVDGSAKVTAACSCGYKAGAFVAVAKDEYCYELADGTGNKVDVACKKTDASAKEDPACSCNAADGVAAVAKDKFCQVVAKKGYVTDSVKCKKSDASVKEDPACSCGYKAGAVAAVAKDAYCFVGPDGTGTSVADPPCKKTDASAKEDPKCSCNGADAIAAVAKDKFCRVVAKKGYAVDAAKCTLVDGGKNDVAAGCSCGYKAGAFVAVAQNEYCWEAADGTGTKVADPPCKKTDASAKEDPKCSCNGADSIAAVAKDKFC